MTPDISLDSTPEITPEITLEVTPEDTPALLPTEFLSADELPALDAEGDPLVANYSQNRTYGPAPLAIQFYDRSTGTVTNRSWEFGDGESSELRNPVHTFASAGTYTVRLTVSDGTGFDTYEVTDRIRADTPEAPVAALSANKTSWSSPTGVQFYDRSTGYPTTWAWDFGDGTTATVKNPVHTYTVTGNYTVTLTVTNDLGTDTVTKTEYFHAYDPAAPTAALSANKTSWSSPAAVQFYDRSAGFPTSWQWDFGDGATATVKNPVHTYAATGNYTVTLVVTNDLGMDTITKTEYFHAYDPTAPTAALSANKTSWSSPAAVQFYDRSAGFPTSWQWDFGDGATATVKNPVHMYTATGNYTVTLTVTNDLGTDTITQTEYFHAYDPIAPTAALSANKTSWSAPAAIQFYDRSTGFPTAWAWDFGDGTTATVKNPVHTYEATGNYTITLTATNDLGTDTITQSKYFHAYDPVAPTALLSANKTSWSSPAAVQFYDRSTGFPTSWQWDFGDGATATVKNPVHTYENTGNYTVTLTVTNDLGTDTVTKTEYFHAYDPIAPTAALSANKTSWSAPAAIQFYDRSNGFPTAWAWDFGDGTTAIVKNPVHTYEATGNYTITLTVTNDLGSDTKTATDYIIVSGSSAPVAAISANKTSWSAPAAIQFYDRSAGFPTAWAWDFGDGTTATVKNPVHTYTATGNYTVNLTVTNEIGSDTKVAVDYIRISDSAAPVAAISANKTSWSSPAAIQFYDRSTGFPTAWAWDFGDGTTSNLKNPVHTYAAIGNYSVNLTITNEVGSDTKVMPDYIRVTNPEIPTAKIAANRTAGPAPIAIQFYDRSTGFPTEWFWDFGDGNTSALKNPVHSYAYGGNYTITLRAANALGNTSVTALNYIKASGTGPAVPVVVDFTANATSGPVPLAVAFTDLSTGSPTSWNWSFGDGSFAEEQNPVHTYAAAGNYSVSLAASSAGSSDSRTRADYITAQSSGPAFDARIEFSAIIPTMLQSEHYLVDVRMNNTGSRTWSGNPASPDYVYLEGLGGISGDAAKFNLTHIPMLFENETVAPGETYDFFFFMQAPDISGNYTPEYQLVSAGNGYFGEVSNTTISVISNPFNPVIFPNGTRQYTTTFSNTTAGIRIDIVGPKAYLDDDFRISDFQDPQYLINPALKTRIIDVELNEPFTYADVTFDYDPAKVPNPANLSISYYNTTTGNYTFYPSTVDTVNHKVTSRVTHFSRVEGQDQQKYEALPPAAQNHMGWAPVNKTDNWTIAITDSGNINTVNWFNGGMVYPPGNYTILASGQYHDQWAIHFLDWRISPGVKSADDDYGPNSVGMYVSFTNESGAVSARVSTLRTSSGNLTIHHTGGPIGISNHASGSYTTGVDVRYKLSYLEGPLTREPSPNYLIQLASFVIDGNVKAAIEYYSSSMGCILGTAGTKGNFVEAFIDDRIGFIPGAYDTFLGEKITTSAAYQVGHLVCGYYGFALATPRDFLASYYAGDDWGMILNGIGLKSSFQAMLKDSSALSQIYVKLGGDPDTYRNVINTLKNAGLFKDADPATALGILKSGRSPREVEIIDDFAANGDDAESIVSKINLRGTLQKAYVWARTVPFNAYAKYYGARLYDPSIKRTVIGTTRFGPNYYNVADSVHANSFYFPNGGYSEAENLKWLRRSVDNGDEIYTSTRVPSEIDPEWSAYSTSQWKKEMDILDSWGYTVSQWPELVTYKDTTLVLYKIVKKVSD